MQVASLNSLIGLKATWEQQAAFYKKRISQIYQEIHNPYRGFSLSYLEGEKQALQRALENSQLAIDELTKIIREVQSD